MPDRLDKGVIDGGDRGVSGEVEIPLIRLLSIIESILFVATKPVSRKTLLNVTGANPEVLKKAIATLQEGYGGEERGIRVMQVQDGYLLVTKRENAEYIRRFLPSPAKVKLGRSALETLSIIAYMQPLTRADIEEVRGVDSTGVIKGLLEKGVVRVLGRKDRPGRPLLYGTTDEFLKVFSLQNLSHLPSLEELKALMMEEEGEGEGGIEIFRKEVEIGIESGDEEGEKGESDKGGQDA